MARPAESRPDAAGGRAVSYAGAAQPRRGLMATTAFVRGSRDKLTVGEVCDDLQIAQSTFYEWRTKGTGPRCIKLPNGRLRVRRSDLETWLDAREDAA